MNENECLIGKPHKLNLTLSSLRLQLHQLKIIKYFKTKHDNNGFDIFNQKSLLVQNASLYYSLLLTNISYMCTLEYKS